MGSDGSHLRLTLGRPGGRITWPAVAWRVGGRAPVPMPGTSIDLVYQVTLDRLHNSPRLEIEDFALS